MVLSYYDRSPSLDARNLIGSRVSVGIERQLRNERKNLASSPYIYAELLMKRTYRVVVAKPGLDGHDRGAKVIARTLRDAGFEVVYTGLHQTPEQIVQAVIQEDADALGLSLLSGAHLVLVPRIVDLLKREGREDVLLIVGGIIPDDDVPELERGGVARVFTPGASLDEIGSWLETTLDERETIS
jgi:methylmalonyl-CoA mutase C-terminal domain/subunit